MIIQLYSGGLDSYLLAKLWPMVGKYLFWDIGQKNRELENAIKNCPGKLIYMQGPQLDLDWAGEIPYRNTMLISMTLAAFPKARQVRMACLRREDGIYFKDTSRAFFNDFNKFLSTQGYADTFAPMISYTLDAAVEKALEKGIDWKPVTFCNVTTTGKNCGACPKCKLVWSVLTKHRRDDLWETFNGE